MKSFSGPWHQLPSHCLCFIQLRAVLVTNCVKLSSYSQCYHEHFAADRSPEADTSTKLSDQIRHLSFCLESWHRKMSRGNSLTYSGGLPFCRKKGVIQHYYQRHNFISCPFALGLTKFEAGCSVRLSLRNRLRMMQDDIRIAIPVLTGS